MIAHHENPNIGENNLDPLHNRVAAIQDRLETLANEDAASEETAPASACLRPLLACLEWAGDRRQLHEVLPHFDEVQTTNDLRAILARLKFETIGLSRAVHQLDQNMLPCLYEASDGNVYVIIQKLSAGEFLVFDGRLNAFMTTPVAFLGAGQTFAVEPTSNKDANKALTDSAWVQNVLVHFRPMITRLFAISFAINLLALTTPLYVMIVYDKAVGAQSLMTLGYLLAGIAIAVGTEVFLRSIRTRYLAYLGSRMEFLVTTGVFEKLLHLPLTMSESAPMGTQLTRLKRFESVRDFFSGGLASAILDLPFVFVFLTTIFAIGGVIGWVPVALIATYATIALFALPIMRTRMQKAAAAQAENRNFLIEFLSKRDAIRSVGVEDIWVDRFKTVSGDALAKQFAAQKVGSTVQSVAQALMVVAGGITVGLGTLFVMQNELSAGALIAVMTLVWRLLTPIQFAFLNLNTFCNARETIAQINSLMGLKTERVPGAVPSFTRKFSGQLDMRNTILRFPNRLDPVLRGVNLSIGAGEFVTVTGPSGAGKSVLLKVLARLYEPQAGIVAIDQLDLRQLEIAELRRSIGFLADSPTFFYGTIQQNFQLANPSATRAEIEEALERVGILERINELPEGLDTRLSSKDASSISTGLAQQISIAQALVKKPSIYLMDEPGKVLDYEADQALIKLFKSLKREATVVAVTQRPSHMNVSDRVIVMKNGVVAAEGPPTEILPKILSR